MQEHDDHSKGEANTISPVDLDHKKHQEHGAAASQNANPSLEAVDRNVAESLKSVLGDSSQITIVSPDSATTMTPKVELALTRDAVVLKERDKGVYVRKLEFEQLQCFDSDSDEPGHAWNEKDGDFKEEFVKRIQNIVALCSKNEMIMYQK